MLIASLSLVAFPYMTGFYSKDLIMESAFGQFSFSSIVVYFIATIGAIFTTLYSVKVLYLTFLANPRGPLINYKQAHEGDIFISLPLIILAIFSIFFGYITKDIYLGLGSAFFADNSVFIHPSHEIMIETEFAVPTILKLLPFISTLLFSGLALVLSEFYPNLLMSFKFTRFGYNLFGFFNQRFLVELFYNKYITGTILALGGQTTKILDKGSIELIGPFGLEKGLLNLSKNIASLDLSYYGIFSNISRFPLSVNGFNQQIKPKPQVRNYSTNNYKPVKVYHNADNKNKSGIYLWTNLQNGKSYVGSAVNLSKIYSQYFSLSYLTSKDSMYICRSLLKHGSSSFSSFAGNIRIL